MLRVNPEQTGQEELFRARLASIIDMRHELVRLAALVEWDALARDFASFYCADNGRPGSSIRLMAGLCFLKDLRGLSDEEVCAQWRENAYFQYFCGEEYLQHRLPVEPPSLSIFRKRIGAKGAERLLAETVKLGLKTGTVTKSEIEKLNVDTTVQEKAIRFPTDTQLCHKAREELVKAAARYDVPLRQTYVRKSKQAVFLANRYMAARQVNRGRKTIKRVRNYLGRVMRDIERACEKMPHLRGAFMAELAKARTIFAQTLNPQALDKLYSWHAPEVECIAKGKAHKKYEFGCKASIASTNKGNFIVGAMAHHGKPYDGHTLRTVLEQVERLTGIKPREANADLGYRGHGIAKEDSGCEVILSRQKRGMTPAKRKRQRRRAAIEPIIGHCKNDRKVGARNWLGGKQGDCINAIAMAIGFNLRKILRKIFLWLLAKWFRWQNLTRPAHFLPVCWVY
jgi:transposase, IS5 family